MAGEAGEPHVVRRRLGTLLGLLLIAAGLAFHAVSAYHRSMEDPLDISMTALFLQWGWLRLSAWAAVAGGVWLVVWSGTRPGRS